MANFEAPDVDTRAVALEMRTAPTDNLPAVVSQSQVPAASGVEISLPVETRNEVAEPYVVPQAYVDRTVASMRSWDREYSADLERRWPGAEMGRNAAMAAAFMQANPAVLGPLSITPGNAERADIPWIIEIGATLGRLCCRVPGDPRTMVPLDVLTRPSPATIKDKPMIDEPDPAVAGLTEEAFHNSLKELNVKIAEAQAEGDTRRANDLYSRQQSLYASRAGNRPVVGRNQRTA